MIMVFYYQNAFLKLNLECLAGCELQNLKLSPRQKIPGPDRHPKTLVYITILLGKILINRKRLKPHIGLRRLTPTRTYQQSAFKI